MAQRQNYNFQKAERDRAKKAKKEAKAQEKAASTSSSTDDVPDLDSAGASERHE
jgi:hypothetical protein